MSITQGAFGALALALVMALPGDAAPISARARHATPASMAALGAGLAAPPGVDFARARDAAGVTVVPVSWLGR